MSLTFKLLSLVIRTAAKPIGNYIKRQAKEHDGFRRFAISQAQRVHRIDMRMRLGILHDPEAQQRMHDREQRAAEEKKRQAETPTVRSEEEQKKHDETKAKEEKEGPKKDEGSRKVKIRPLSDARAIELGANFFSEAFIFAVAAGLLIWDSWRSRRKANQRRDDVTERLEELEAEVLLLKSAVHPESLNVEEMIERLREPKQPRTSWWNPFGWGQNTAVTGQDEPTSQKAVPEATLPSTSISTSSVKDRGAVKPEEAAKDTKAANSAEKPARSSTP